MDNILRTTDLNRQSPFGFSCQRCLTCCRCKKIQLNPYEIARLADNRGMAIAEFIARYTTTGGTVLRFTGEGACVFLDAQGCAVHPDRPLVCRLYPLGRYVDYLGVETFACIEPDKGCRGTLSDNGTIVHYLEEQEAAPFMHAADRYLDLLWHLLEMVKERQREPAHAASIDATVRAVAAGAGATATAPWIDMDQAVAEYCRRTGIPVPEERDKKMMLHIKAVRKWAA